MGTTNGFMKIARTNPGYRDKNERIRDYDEVAVHLSETEIERQAERCMECGTPFCHGLGCPLGNLVPEMNDAARLGRWREAYERLSLTNPFPEITGRVCPALCEPACTLSVNADSVAIREIELAVAERAFREGWVVPRPPRRRRSGSVAVVGSGPSGLACAQELARLGHEVTVYEKADRIGGILRFGIPDFKLEKRIIDRRIALLEAEGIRFETGVLVGKDLSAAYLRSRHQAVVIAAGSGVPRNLEVPGRDSDGIHYAMDYLSASNRFVAGLAVKPAITAEGKRVLVLGGGDTGSDCVGTAVRQKAAEVRQFEIMPKPMEWNLGSNPVWPQWPQIYRTTSSHLEGCVRDFSIATLGFEGNPVNRAMFARVEWKGREMTPIPGSEFELEVDLVLLCLGFTHVEHGPLVRDLELELDARGNLVTENTMTSVQGVFAGGDSVSGASLVVRAIESGKKAANSVSNYLD